MKYTNGQYAEALIAALDGKTNAERRKIAGRFFRALARHRALSRLNRVILEAERRRRRRDGLLKVDVGAAAPLRPKSRLMLEKILGKKTVISETVQEELGAGVRILINEEKLIDASARRKLSEIFQK